MVLEAKEKFKNRTGPRYEMNLTGSMSLLLIVLLCSGFTWGKSKEERCEEAKKLITNHLKLNSVPIPDDLAKNVEKLCPDRAASYFIRGFNAEQQKNYSQAEQLYQDAVKFDDRFPDAYGHLGLLEAARNDRERAVLSLTEALEKGGTDSKYHVALAKMLLQDNLYSLALYHFKQAIKLGALEDEALLAGSAHALSALNRPEEAASAFRKALKINPDSPELLAGYAAIHAKLHRFDDAIGIYKTLLEKKPRSPELHQKLADAYTAKGDKASAEAELRAAGKKIPTLVETLVQQGDALFLKRDYAAAIRAYSAASEQHTDLKFISQKLGDAYSAVGNDEEALKQYQQAIALMPKDIGTHYSMGVILERKGDLSGAIGEYERVVALDYNDSDAHRRLADIYTTKGDLERAIAEYQSILFLKADNPVIHFKLAKVYLKTRKYDNAVKSLNAAIALDPKNVELKTEMAALKIRLHKYPEAEKQYRDIQALDRDNTKAKIGLISMLSRQKKFDELLLFLNEEAKRRPEDANNFYRLGIVNEYMKNYQTALIAYNAANAIHENARIYNALARIYLRLADSQKAREALKSAQALDPKRKDTQDLLSLLDEDERLLKRRVIFENKTKKHHVNKTVKKPKTKKAKHRMTKKQKR